MDTNSITKNAFHEDLIGEAILKIVEIESRIERLEFMLPGASDSLQAVYRTQLHEERTLLRTHEMNINYLRRRLIDVLQDRIVDYERTASTTYNNPTSKEDLVNIVKALHAKIALVQNAIDKTEAKLIPTSSTVTS